jgi:hypothetical protein
MATLLYIGQLTSPGAPGFDTSWTIELGGPQPTIAQISISSSLIDSPFPSIGSFNAGYIQSYFFQGPTDIEPIQVELSDFSSDPNLSYVSMACHPYMTSVAFIVTGNTTANVNVQVLPGWNVPIVPPSWI